VGIDIEKNFARLEELANSMSLPAGYKLSADMALEKAETSHVYAALVGVCPVSGY